MKKLYLAMVGGLLTLSATAQKTWQTQHYGKMYADTTYHVTVGPGTEETRVKLNFSTSADDTPNASAMVNYLTIDLTNPYVTLKVNRAGNTTDYVKKSVKNMMAENTTYQKHYFAGVNGDFFGDVPCGICVSNGAFANTGATMSNGLATNQLVIDKDGVPTIASKVDFNGSVDPGWMVHTDPSLGTISLPDGQEIQSVRMNTSTRWEGYMVAYSDIFMKLDYNKVHTEIDASGNTIKDEDGNPKQFPNQTGYTSQNHWGVEAQLYPANGEKQHYGEPVEYIVGQVNQSGRGGNMKIPTGGLVISANNCDNTEHPYEAAKGKIDQLKSGDRVTLNFPFIADGNPITCRETVGGYPRLVVDGESINAAPSNAPGDLALSARRARTAVGYNKDKTKMYIFVVQDRVISNGTREDGMTVKALAGFMQAVGCHEALNLDGGGSSVLYVENLGQRSDVQASWTYQRPVINGLFAVTEAPEDREVARIEFVDKSLTIQPGRGYQPVIYAYNQYGVLISSGLQNYTLSADEATFDSSKRKMIAPESGYFALTATYNGITTSIPVKVDASGISGSDPATAPSFSGNEITSIPEKPEGWVDPNITNLYVCGKFQNWDFFKPAVIQPNLGENGVYEFDIDSSEGTTIDATYFKMTTLDPVTNGGSKAFADANSAWHIANTGANFTREYPEILGNNVTLSILPGNENNISAPWNGNWHYVVNIADKTITATTTTPRPELTADKVALVAEIDGVATELELEGENGVYSIENTNITGTEVSFSIDGVAYGATVNGKEFSDSEYCYQVANKWSVKPGPYTVSIDIKTGKVKLLPFIFAMLEDVTPAGYDFDKYDEGTAWKFATLPTSSTSNTWTAPGGIYSQEAMDADGQVSAFHVRGVAMDQQNLDHLAAHGKGFSVQKHPNKYVGNCLVYNREWSPGASVYNWPVGKNNELPYQLTFYADASKIKDAVDPEHPVRFRLVFQVLYRGRHDQTKANEIPCIYASASAASAWALSFDGVSDDVTGSEFPIDHRSFYRWEDEGSTIAEMPSELIVRSDYTGTPEPWDANGTANPYLINDERFMVYEFDMYGVPDNGTIAVHLNFSNVPWATFIFKEVKFFNVLNGKELLESRPGKTPSRAANIANPFETNTARGSLLGTRNISYRYYTEEGVKEFKSEETNTGVDDIITDTNDNAPVEYFNLQGVKVENPSTGLYIKRQGQKTSKVVIR